MSDRDFAIQVEGLTKRFGRNVALDRVSLSVPRGITYGLLGPNGAGKSTLIRTLMGLSEADSGIAQTLGCDVRDRSPEVAMSVGYVPELHFMYRWMRIQELIDFVSRLYGAKWDTALAEALLDKFELPQRKRVAALSKGMTAKLGLLIGLAHNPTLLILDEPTSGLDPVIREDFLESVLQSPAGDGGRTVFFSSHHVDDVERVSDRVGLMLQGKLAVEGPVDQLRERIKRVRFVLPDGKLPQSDAAEIVHQTIDRREWTVTLHPFSVDGMHRIGAENNLPVGTVIDLNLEEIFKDFARGSRRRDEEQA